VNDVLDLVAAYRPTSDALDAQWPEPARRAILDQVLADSGAPTTAHRRATRRRYGRRLVLTGALISAAAVAAVAVQIVLPSHHPGGAPPAAAEALERLANTAARQPGTAGPGQYRHAVVRMWDADASRPTEVDELWAAYDGRVWFKQTSGGQVSYSSNVAGSHFPNLSSQFMATLPTDPTALRRYLLAHTGVPRGAEDDTKVLIGMISGFWKGSGSVPPALAAATIRMLEHTDGIEVTQTHDPLGRPAIRVDWHGAEPTDVTRDYFDPKTSAWLGIPGLTVVSDGTTEAVPADVVAGVAKTFVPGSAPTKPKTN
jgi:hypothetical protein